MWRKIGCRRAPLPTGDRKRSRFGQFRRCPPPAHAGAGCGRRRNGRNVTVFDRQSAAARFSLLQLAGCSSTRLMSPLRGSVARESPPSADMSHLVTKGGNFVVKTPLRGARFARRRRFAADDLGWRQYFLSPTVLGTSASDRRPLPRTMPDFLGSGLKQRFLAGWGQNWSIFGPNRAACCSGASFGL